MAEVQLTPQEGFAPQRIIACGSTLTRTGDAFHSLLLLADGLQPLGVAEVYADPYSVAAVLGAVAQVNSAAFAQVSETAFTRLGVLISLHGNIAQERLAVRLKIKTEDGETLRAEVKGGHLLSLPLPSGVYLEVSLATSRGVRVGSKTRLRLKLEGGEGGILIDARGRAFVPAQDVTARAAQLPLWYHEATDQPAPQIPPEWLKPPAAEDESLALSEDDLMDDLRGEQPRRRRLFASASQADRPPKPERGRRARKITQKVSETTATARSDEEEIDDEFAALIGEAPHKAASGRDQQKDKAAKDAKRSTTEQLREDMDLRDLL